VLFRSALDKEHAHLHARFEIANQWAPCALVRQHPLTALAREGHLTNAGLVGRRTDTSTGGATPAPQGAMGVLRFWRSCSSTRPTRSRWARRNGPSRVSNGAALLRTPIDQLRASDHATLPERFVAISEEPENIATSAQGSTETNAYKARDPGRQMATTAATQTHLVR
jgi:hypothetical protein